MPTTRHIPDGLYERVPYRGMTVLLRGKYLDHNKRIEELGCIDSIDCIQSAKGDRDLWFGEVFCSAPARRVALRTRRLATVNRRRLGIFFFFFFLAGVRAS